MKGFDINGDHWNVRIVDKRSTNLIDRTNQLRLATTDPETMTVYLSNALSGDMLTRVLIHEIGHCVMVSNGLISELHQMVKPRYWIEVEEWVCNFIADYGLMIFDVAKQILGARAIVYMPEILTRFAA